jgi:transaldolase
MLLLVDSADRDEIRRATATGLVTGVTMNPALVAARAPTAPLDVLAAALDVSGAGPVFYQPTSPDRAEAALEVDAAVALAPDRVVIKLPAVAGSTPVARRLYGAGVPVALTAVYAPAQALVAAALGCRWVIPYVDRARRLLPDAPPVVPALAAVLRGGGPRILAASVKSGEQAVEAVLQGAHAITAPLAVLEQLIDHPLSDSAVAEFDAAVRRATDR